MGLKIIKIEINMTQRAKQVVRIVNVVEITVRTAFEAPVVEIDDTSRSLWYYEGGNEECKTDNRRQNKCDFKTQ
jgi:hypothetical protein